ncbi:MAG: MBL fold metallo-hydrolase [Chitinophagaceae bacterium]|nr:MBL fold metallo-hydrolase [Chitinophagaceae bacterium]
MEQLKICGTCGTHYLPHASSDVCEICNDDRQYIPDGGQIWITPDQLQRNNSVRLHKLHERVYELQIKPTFAIGQRALLILSDQGNILWDCIPLLNEPTISFIKTHGGLKAIAFSHPHYYSNMNDWAEVFDCKIYIHQNDEQWIFNMNNHINLWTGQEKKLWDGIRLINIGGHFPGSSILHVPFLSKEGTVFCGDTLAIAPNKKHIAVMYSYPNRIPLSLQEMNRIKNRLDKIPFDSLYGFYSDQNLSEDVKKILAASLHQYI